MRNLATIQTVDSLSPIEGADAIEVARILGWNVVVKKGEFNVGDLCIYVEIDSVLPEREEFEFLRNRKFRVKTIRLRGQISQGICFQLGILSDDMFAQVELNQNIIGADVTDILGINKYEPYIPACLRGSIRGSFPSWFSKTDETRVQVLQQLLDQYKGTCCYVTEKVDGTSVSFYLQEEQFGVCSRNLDLKEDATNTYWMVALELRIEEKLRGLAELLGISRVAIQGEICGPGIQGNKLQLAGLELFVFNIYDGINGKYLDYADFVSAVSNVGLRTVPILNDAYILDNDLDKILEEAKGNSVLAAVPREGIVIRPLVETVANVRLLGGSRFSFKAINNDFLLKYSE